jgi:hypothetical protein
MPLLPAPHTVVRGFNLKVVSYIHSRCGLVLEVLGKLFKFIIAYCYHFVDVISFSLSQKWPHSFTNLTEINTGSADINNYFMLASGV